MFAEATQAEIARINSAIAVLEQEGEGDLVLENGKVVKTKALHPIDKSHLRHSLGSFLKEITLRKREIEPLAYGKWLREQREMAITGMIESNASSPAHILYELELPVLREEIRDADRQDTQPKAASFKKDVTKLILDGQLEAALEMAMSYAEQEAADHLHDTIHLLSEYRHYEDRERKGILDQQTISTARARIRDALLQLASLMGNEK